MFCLKCGARLAGDSIFCHTCGTRINAGCDIYTVPEIPEPEPLPLPVPEPVPVPVPEEVFRAIEVLETALPPEQRTVMITGGKKEKEYFGFPALVFCLTVIALLSVACGVLLATLYFGGL
jgi:hypothetical protein